MKKIFEEFKTFISRGNVIDLAVGVIIGGAFSSIVTALTTSILQPIINWIIALVFGGSADEPVYTMLHSVYDANGALDMTSSIYINWGEFISAIINFFLIAIVLFAIIKMVNKVNEGNGKLKSQFRKNTLTRAELKEMKALGLNYKDLKAIREFKEKKEAELKAEEEKKAQAEKEAEEEAKKHTTEGLLEEILKQISKE